MTTSEYLYTDEDELRDAFWADNGHLVCKTDSFGERERQNRQPCDTRAAWVDWLDSVHRNGMISDELVQSATL